jgi:hypothetical protein
VDHGKREMGWLKYYSQPRRSWPFLDFLELSSLNSCQYTSCHIRASLIPIILPLSPLIRYQTATNRKDCFRLGDVTDPSWEVMDPAKPRKGIVLKCVGEKKDGIEVPPNVMCGDRFTLARGEIAPCFSGSR